MEQTEETDKLSNSLIYCFNKLKSEGFITDTSPTEISAVSVTMGEKLYQNILDMLTDEKIIIDEDIALNKLNEGEKYNECSENVEDIAFNEIKEEIKYNECSENVEDIAFNEIMEEIKYKESSNNVEDIACNEIKEEIKYKECTENVENIALNRINGDIKDNKGCAENVENIALNKITEDKRYIKEYMEKARDPDYVPDEPELSFNHIPLSYKARTVALAEAHPKWSLNTLKRKGCSRLTSMKELKRWTNDIKRGGTKRDKWRQIEMETFERFTEARNSSQQVTTKTIQQWAMSAASSISETFVFHASKSWVKRFKRKYKVQTKANDESED